MSAHGFMRYTFLASTFIAITCGVVGVYVIARGFSLLTHTLSETGSAGTVFTMWISWVPLWGMVLFTLFGSVSAGRLSIKNNQEESVISAILALSIGLGMLFLATASDNSRYTTNVSLGSTIGVDREGIIQLVILPLFVLTIVFLALRQLNYDSFDHVGTISHHISTSLVSVVFSIALALAVSVDAQVVGSLLAFILLALSSLSVCYLGRAIPAILYWSVEIALVGVWIGLALGYITNLPVIFFISIIEVGIYLFIYGVHATKK